MASGTTSGGRRGGGYESSRKARSSCCDRSDDSDDDSDDDSVPGKILNSLDEGSPEKSPTGPSARKSILSSPSEDEIKLS